MTPGRTPLRRHRGSDRDRARRRPCRHALKNWGLAPASPARRTAPSSRAWSRRAAPQALRGLAHGRRRARGRSSSACCSCSSGWPSSASRACAGRALRATRRSPTTERERLDAPRPRRRPPPVGGDYPDWLEPSLTRVPSATTAPEVAGARRARARRPAGQHAQGRVPREGARRACRISTPSRRRIRRSACASRRRRRRAAAVEAEPAVLQGLVRGPGPGLPGRRLCAGANGQAGARPLRRRRRQDAGAGRRHGNTGQIYANDSDARRLAPIRRGRPGRRPQPAGPHAARPGADPLKDLDGKMDWSSSTRPAPAPARGGATRRQVAPAPGSLDARRQRPGGGARPAARFVKPGGRIVYVTCSVLPEENEDRVAAFLRRDRRLRARSRAGGAANGRARRARATPCASPRTACG